MTERIDWPDLYWTVLIDVHENECVASFRLISWVAKEDPPPFWPAGQAGCWPATTDPALANVECEGSVKWDGCSDIGTNTDCQLHGCRREDVVNFTRALLRACDAAFDRVPKRDPEAWPSEKARPNA